jgi:hypothetical protein
MADLLSHLVDAPLANILILAGLVFLGIGIVGKISGKIEPSTTGRIMSGLLGMALLIYGIYAHSSADKAGPARPKQGNSGPDSALSGDWRNDNPQTRGITRLEVRRKGDLVVVHAWGACSPQDCDWGTEKAALSQESATVSWDQGFVRRNMTLVPDAGRLRMLLDSVYRDNRPPQHGVEYFVKSP